MLHNMTPSLWFLQYMLSHVVLHFTIAHYNADFMKADSCRPGHNMPDGSAVTRAWTPRPGGGVQAGAGQGKPAAQGHCFCGVL